MRARLSARALSAAHRGHRRFGSARLRRLSRRQAPDRSPRFKTQQQAAFDAERERWQRGGAERVRPPVEARARRLRRARTAGGCMSRGRAAMCRQRLADRGGSRADRSRGRHAGDCRIDEDGNLRDRGSPMAACAISALRRGTQVSAGQTADCAAHDDSERDMNLSTSTSLAASAYRSGTLHAARLVRSCIDTRARACADDNIWISIARATPNCAPYRERLTASDPARAAAVRHTVRHQGQHRSGRRADHRGCPAFAYTPRHSAHVVQRLIDAGAIPIGKTNLDQFATGLVGTRSPYGAARNASIPTYISGGSSSGSAVAVRLGLVELRARHRHRGLRPRAGGVQQSGRPEADARSC